MNDTPPPLFITNKHNIYIYHSRKKNEGDNKEKNNFGFIGEIIF